VTLVDKYKIHMPKKIRLLVNRLNPGKHDVRFVFPALQTSAEDTCRGCRPDLEQSFHVLLDELFYVREHHHLCAFVLSASPLDKLPDHDGLTRTCG